MNCEVSPKDPAGITTPYRLLVPALNYDGSSDLNHEHEHEHAKKKGWFKFGRNRRRSSTDGEQPQDGQGYSGVEAYKEKKRRWF